MKFYDVEDEFGDNLPLENDVAMLTAMILKDLKETAGDESYSSLSDFSNDEELGEENCDMLLSSENRHRFKSTSDSTHHRHRNHHHPHLSNSMKTHVERRFYRNFLWGSISWFLSIGRFLSRIGVRGAQLGAMRRVTRFGAGIRRETMPGVDHHKCVIKGVKCRVYRPKFVYESEPKPGPVCIFIHGGGWVMCSARVYHSFTLELSKDLGAIVISIDYRLAPEHPWPTPLDDCLSVIRAVANADADPQAIGPYLAGRVDTSKIAVCGDSAGGNLSCCSVLDMIRNNETPRPCGLCLICPSLQAVVTGFKSYQQFAKHSTARGGWFLCQFAGVQPNRKILRATKLGKHVPIDLADKFVSKFINKTENTSESINLSKIAQSEYDKETVGKEVPEAVTKLAMSTRAWPLLADEKDLVKVIKLEFILFLSYCL